MHIVNRPNDMKFFFDKFDQVVIWYLIDMHRTYRVFFLLLHVYGWNGFFLIENPIYKIFYTNQGGRSGLWWLGKIRHHYAGNLLIFPLIFLTIFSLYFFYFIYIIKCIYHTIHLNGFPDPIILYFIVFKL